MLTPSLPLRAEGAPSRWHVSVLVVVVMTAVLLMLLSDPALLQTNTVPRPVATRRVPMTPKSVQEVQPSRRRVGATALSLLGAALGGNLLSLTQPPIAWAASVEPVPVWFGSGCFWGRQYDFVQLEKSRFQRTDNRVTALSGYAGGTKVGPDGLNCYFGGPSGTLYEENGQAEVVQLMLDGANLEEQFTEAIRLYFRQFRRLPTGQMLRQDPQDMGPAYRSVLGIPGGINSPLMDIVRRENVNRMKLLEGKGNDGDALNVVWVMDTARFPFYRAERYHQFHRGLGMETFGPEYLRDLRQVQNSMGRIAPTGCPDI